MKKTVSLILAVMMLLGCMSLTAFATDNNKTEITATVENTLTYKMVIPSAVTMTEAGVKEIGAPSVTDIKYATDDTVISYTAAGTQLTLVGGTATMATSYYTDSTGTTAMPSTAIEVYKSKALVDPLTTLYVGVAQSAWDAAENGTYKATVTFNFTAEEESTEGATFKAVAVKDETNSTQQKTYYDLTFYFDKKNHNPNSSADIIVYDNLPTAASSSNDWGYNGIRNNIKSVTIDQSIQNLQGLTKTVGMFAGMQYADDITGAEYLDMSKVTSAKQMFSEFGKTNETLSVVPNVSGWNVQRITDMSSMFASYGSASKVLNAVPDVSSWVTYSVEDIGYMFEDYAMTSTALTAVPDISNWYIDDLSDMDYLFKNYGKSSSVLNFTLDLSGWVNLGDMTSNGTNTFANVGKTGSTWSVTIPYETLCDDEPQDPRVYNTAEKWYGFTEDTYITPKTGCSFTVAPAPVD